MRSEKWNPEGLTDRMGGKVKSEKLIMRKVMVLLAMAVVGSLMVSCGEPERPLPKPKGYFRIDLPEKDYVRVDTLQRYASGTYKAPYQNGSLTCNGTTSVTFNIPNDKWGSYLFVINDKQGKHTFAKVINFDWGYGHSSSATGAPAQLSLKTTAESYEVGEKMVVTFPANDKAKALVTVEANDKVLQTMLVENLGEEGKVEITATEEMIPNVYIYVALIQPHDAKNDLPIRLYGVVPVKVENKKLQLQPNIQIPETANTKKKIDVKVSEAAGQAMTYTLAIVDEGILGLTNFSTPNPYGYFNSKQALSVRTWDNYASIVDAFSGELGSVYAIGGDGVLNQEVTLDKRFKAYAVTLGPFELKAGDANTHSFEVPQCSGALRFMVVAKGKGKAFGSSDKRMTVVDPINLYASAPRVVAPGDELNLKVQVQAPTMKNKTLEVKFQNKNLDPIGALPTSVKIDGNGEGLVAVRTTIPKTLGNAELKVMVTGDGYTAESSTLMPIRMPYAERRNTITKEIEAGQTVTVPFNLAGMDGTQQGNVTVSSLLPIDLFGRIDYLLNYPHGCLEQTTSKAFPQLYLNYFIQLDDKAKEEMKTNVETAVTNLKSYQKSDNSMTNWPGGNYTNPWTEIYALHFLVEANKQGYNVPQYFIDGLLSYQADRAKQWKNNIDYKWGETIQAYRLFVLALAGKPEMGNSSDPPGLPLGREPASPVRLKAFCLFFACPSSIIFYGAGGKSSAREWVRLPPSYHYTYRDCAAGRHSAARGRTSSPPPRPRASPGTLRCGCAFSPGR